MFKSTKHLMIANIIGFQIGWFSCILGAANGIPWLATAIAMALVLVHISVAANKANELQTIGLAILFGLAFDSIPVYLGWIAYPPTAEWSSVIAPPWILALWGLFASTLNISLNWLKTKPVVAVILGFLLGPLSYLSGEKLGALKIIASSEALVFLAIVWAIGLPLLLKVAQKNPKG